MKAPISLRRALNDPRLLGKALSGPSWITWRILLLASMGESLRSDEQAIFTKLTQRQSEPLERVEEAYFIIGRRGGKSRAMAVLATYLSALCQYDLAKGEQGVALIIAPDQRQAAICLSYCEACFEQSPMLKQLVLRTTADTIELKGSISIEVRAASFRRLRGLTLIACIADESAFFHSDESSNPDVEILNACRPSLSTQKGPLFVCSSPYARRGVLWDGFRKHYGPKGDPLILVARGSSRDLNPSLPQSVIDRALARDFASASAEYLAQFRSDIETFVSYEIVSACIGDHVEMAPLPDQKYHAFVDPSGGSADSFTAAIAHRDGERFIVDAIREIRPPFSPEAVIDDLSTLLQTYRIERVTGDRYAGEFPRELFRKRGIEYRCAEKPKSDLFRDLLPLLNSGRIVLPKSDRLTAQLCGLERRTARSGKDSIDHGPGSHDDLANAVAGAADCILTAARREFPPAVFGIYAFSVDVEEQRRAQRLKRFEGPLPGGGYATNR
jgi:hypothetical protein